MISHAINNKGESVVDSAEEIQAWIQSRKNNFPGRNKPFSNHQTPGAIERLLRREMRSSYQPSLKGVIPPSAFVPGLRSIVPVLKPNKRKSAFRYRFAFMSPSQYLPHNAEDQLIAEKWDASFCRSLLRNQRCRAGRRCKFSHDRQLFLERKRQFDVVDSLDVPKRPPLLYQLLAPDIQRYEMRILQAIRFLVNDETVQEAVRQTVEGNNGTKRQKIIFRKRDSASSTSSDSNSSDGNGSSG